MPSRCAVSVISCAKSSIEPPTPSASRTAMSFADFTIIILIALSTVTWVPTGKPILVGSCARALARDREQGVGRDAVIVERAERDVERHQLGHRSRIPRIGRVLGAQDFSAVGVDKISASACAGAADTTAPKASAPMAMEPKARPSTGARRQLVQSTCRGPFFGRARRAARVFAEGSRSVGASLSKPKPGSKAKPNTAMVRAVWIRAKPRKNDESSAREEL